MDDRLPGPPRALLLAACAALCAAGACKREPSKTNGAPPAPVTGGAAPASVAPPGAEFTMDAADESGTASAPLRIVLGSRGAGVAWVVQRADGTHVVHDGRVGRAVETVDQISVSPDGRRIAYAAQVEGTWRMLVDGELGVPSISAVNPAFSPDSRHVAYVVGVGQTKRVVVDAKEGPDRRNVTWPPVFSADSDLVAFAEVPADGQPARLVVSDLALSVPTVTLGGVQQLVANDARSAIAAVVEEKGKKRVVVVGFSRGGTVAKGPLYDTVSDLALGADGTAVAYVAEKDGGRLLVAGGREAPMPEGSVVGKPVIRPGRGGVGVLVASSGGVFLHEAFTAADGAEAQRYEEAAELAYSGDGRSWAFCGRRGDSWFVVVNGREGPPFDRVVTPTFSPDGKLVAYRARKDGRRFAVIADANARTLRQLQSLEQVFPIRFTADGKAITYGMKDGRRLGWKVDPV